MASNGVRDKLSGLWDWLENQNISNGRPTWGDQRLSVSLISFLPGGYKMLVETRTQTNEWT